MKPQLSLNITRRDLNVCIACLLSFSLLMMPFIQVAAASRGSNRQSRVNRDKSSQASTAMNVSAANAPLSQPAPEPFVPSISATKSAALIGDDGDMKADPSASPAAAEKIEYTVTISNAAGAMDATGVTFTDTIDAHTTLVPGSVNTQPIADPDTYTASGNIGISVAAPGVRANDRDPDTGDNTGLTVTEVQGSAANVGVSTDTTATGFNGVKGKVTLNANGGFTYEPAPGFNGDDTFTYKVSDGTLTDTATVKITISQMVWFIQNNAGGSNIGTFSNPFTSIASFNTANALANTAPNPKTGDFIVLRTGTGSYNEADGINLRAQQKLIGNGILFNSVFTADANSIAAYNTFATTVSAAPNITTTAGNGVDLATDNIVRGLNVGNTPGFFKINGTAVGGPIINTVSLSGTGGALNVSTSGAFAGNVTFGQFESTSSPGANVNLVGVSGTLAVTTTGTGLSGSAAASSAVNVSGGSVIFSYPGAVTKSSGTGALVSVSGTHTGTLTFGGTLSATQGTGLQFSDADGTYNFSGMTTLNGGDAGVDILSGSGGTFTFSAGTTITSPSGTAFNVSTGAPNVTYSGSITDNTAGQRAVNIDGTTGGAISISSVTTASTAGGVSNTGININNVAGNVTFTTLNMGLLANRATAHQVTITGGTGTYALGTVNIFTTGASAKGIVASNADGTINSTSGTVDASGSPAIDIAGPGGMTTLGMTLIKVAASGGPNGLILTNTNGAFTVNGDGTNARNGSGGTIQNTTDDGVRLTNTNNVTLKAMNFTNTGTATGIVADNQGTGGDHAVEASTGSNLILSAITVTTPGGSGVVALDLSGTSRINLGSLFTAINNSQSHAVYFKNTTVSNTLFEINDVDFTNSTSAASKIFATNGTGGANVQFDIVNGCLFTNLSSQAVTITPGETAGATGTFTSNVKNSTFSNAPVGFENNLAVLVANNATHVATVESNTFDNIAEDGSIANTSIVRTQNSGGKLTANIKSNTIQNITYATGGRHVIGHIFEPAAFNGANFSNITIDGNTVTNVTYLASTNREFAFVDYRLNASGGNVTIKNNNWNMPSAGTQQAIELRFRQANASTVNLLINNNTGVHNTTGVYYDIDAEAAATVNATVTGNSLGNSGTTASAGIDFATELNTASMCVNVSGNTITPAATDGIRLAEGAGNMTVTQASAAAVSAANGGATVATTGTPTFGQPACTQPSAPITPSSFSAQLNSAPPKDSIDAVTSAAATTVIATAAAGVSGSSLFARVLTAVADFASAVHSMVEPTANASAETPRSDYVATAVDSGNRATEVSATYRPADNNVRKATRRTQNRTVSNHARASRAMTPTPMFAGETININIGTLRPDDSVTIKFQVTVNNPPNLTLLNPARVRNEGKVSGTNFSDVFTNQVDTNVDLFDSQTMLESDLNPANQGDTINFTATVAIHPSQTPTPPSPVTPTGTVTFKSDGVDIAGCVNLALNGSAQAVCTTNALTPPSHDITALYSGDGNYDPSTSNTVTQTVIACLTNPTVTSTADDGSAGTLRHTIANVCNNNTITFDLTGAGPHTITLTMGEIPVAKNVTIKNTSGESITVSGNDASRVFNINSGQTVNIIGLTLADGSASGDGGAVINNGTLTIVNSTLSGNAASGNGGGIANSATATSLTLINTTISGNTATGSGGGLVVLGGTATSVNSTITNNTADFDNNASGTGGGIHAAAGTTTLKNTIVASNFNEDGGSDAADDISGTVDAASSFNLIGTGGAGGLTNGVNDNQVGVADAGLGPLANNGGTTQTHALSPTSAAVETGGNANLPADTFDLDADMDVMEALPVDQRGAGFPRNADSQDANTTQTVDIGAFELHPSVEDITDKSVAEDNLLSFSFNLGDGTGSLIASVTATSDNATLVPNANINVTGSGSTRTIDITPALNANTPSDGTATITVTVTATNGRTAVDTFVVTVTEVNDNPVAGDDTLTAIDEDSGTRVIPFADLLTNDTAGPANESGQMLTITNVSNPVGGTVAINGMNVEFTPTANFFGTASFDYTVTDNGTTNGVLDAKSDTGSVSFTINAINDPPSFTIAADPPASDEDDGPQTVLNFATDISAGPNETGQVLTFNITPTGSTGTLTFSSGPAIDATTGTLTYTATADTNGTASFDVTLSDDGSNMPPNSNTSAAQSFTITVNAQNDNPVVTTSAGNLSFTEGDAATAIDPLLTVTDLDSPNLVGATVAITSGFDNAQDTLAFVNTATITGNYNSGSGVLTLTGSDTVANYQTALRSVTYHNGSDNPTMSRTVTFTADDGIGTGSAMKGITINAVNDPPVNTVPGAQSTNQNMPLTFSSGNGNLIAVSDVDAGTNVIQVTLTATNGTLTLNGVVGLNFGCGGCNGDGTADATMTFQGTIADINTALDGMTFTPTMGFSGAATLTINTNDLGNSGSGGPLFDEDTVNIQVATNVSIQDAQVVEPKNGTVNMIFTVTLSAPAPAGGSSVDFDTQDQPPAISHAVAGEDYTATSGTINFAAGEQFKTIQVEVLSDNKKNETNETFEVVLSNPVNLTIADGTAIGTILIEDQAGAVLISELRTSGPDGATDEFVEIYNNSNSPHTVNTPSGGYGLFKMGASCSATPVLLGVIPNGTVIPGRGHFLFTGSAYSLADYGGTGVAAGDVTMSSDIENDRNVALFSTTVLGEISSANRLDAVGFGPNVGGTCDLFREGDTLTPTVGSVLEYTYFRDECGKKGNPSTFGPCPTGGLTKDSNVNADDFIYANTTATSTVAGQRLGAPGPQNLGSPDQTFDVLVFLLDSSKGASGTPNRVRDTTAIGPNAAEGTMSIRRRFQNDTGAPVTKLRIRVVDISTTFVSGGVADLRLLSSSDITVSVNDSATCTAAGFATTPCNVTVVGTTVETPPTQPLGGGFNSSATIILGTPLMAGASVNLQLLLGVQNAGSFKFFFNVEALP